MVHNRFNIVYIGSEFAHGFHFCNFNSEENSSGFFVIRLDGYSECSGNYTRRFFVGNGYSVVLIADMPVIG